MNLQQLCRHLIVKKLESSEVTLEEFSEKKSENPYGSIYIRYRIGGMEGTSSFLTKYPKDLDESTKKLNLFKNSHFKENIAQVILKEIEELFYVNFVPELYFSSRDLMVYDAEPTIFNLDEHYDVGLATLAKFHAASEAYINLISKEYNIGNIEMLNENPFGEKKFMEICSLILKYFDDFKEIYPHTYLDDINHSDIEEKLNNISRKLNEIQDRKKLLINGNFSHQNLVFNALNTECKIVDFSCIAYQSPLYDLFNYVSSFSSKSNWSTNSDKTKKLYYEFLDYEMKKLNMDTNEVFPKGEYEKTFDLMSPIMKILFHLKPIHENFEKGDTTSLRSHYFEILDVLDLKPSKENNSLISFEDCYAIFQKLKVDEAKLLSFRTEQQEGRNGFLGEHHDMTLEIEVGGEIISKSFFLKAVPQSEALQEFAKTVGSFYKETKFYSRYVTLLKEYGVEILDELLPECYFADEYKYIILDNLKFQGYKTSSPRDEMKNDTVLAVIEVLAKFNASCIILEELIERKTGHSYRLKDHFEVELKEAFYSLEDVIESHRNSGKGGMTALTELVDFDDVLDTATFKFLAEKACDDQVHFAKPSDKWRNTLCHGDFWTKNYMTKVEEGRVKVAMIDFQTYRYAPPAQDLMAFIYLNTESNLRQRFMDKWLDFYYEVFSENLRYHHIDVSHIVPRRDFEESCRFYQQFAITQSITHFQIILVPNEIMDPMLGDQKNAREIFLGSRYDLVRMVWPMDEVYRGRLAESLGELRTCLIEKRKQL